MALLVFYCERCNRRISPEEMEDEEVVKTESGYICSNCASMLNLQTIKQKKKSKSRPNQTEKKRASRITTYSIREEAVDEYQLYGLDKKAPARPIPQPVPKKSNSLLIVGIIGLVVVVVIIIAAAGGGSSSTDSFADRKTASDYSQSGAGKTANPTDTTKTVERGPSIFENPWKEREEPTEHSAESGEPEDVASSSAEEEGRKPWMEEFREALEYKRNNPNDYAGVKQRLTEIIQKYESRIKWSERDRIISELDRWDEEWRKRAERAFQNAKKQAKEAETLDEKIRVWKEFPEKFLEVGDTKQKVEEALQLFELVKEAITAFDEALRKAEEFLKKKDYIEAGFVLNEWKGNYVEPFEGTEDEEEMLAMLSEQLEKCEQMKERIDKEWEEHLAKQSKREDKEPQDKEQPVGGTPWSDWKAYKEYLERAFSAVDGDPSNSELRPGSSAVVTKVSRLGQNVNFDGRMLVNRGAADGGIIPAFKKMYLWETYTFTLRIKVLQEEARIGIRMNSVENRGVTGSTGRLAASGDWVELKIEVGKTSAEVYINGQRHTTIQLSEDSNPPTGFPSIILPPDGRAEIETWRIELKTIRK